MASASYEPFDPGTLVSQLLLSGKKSLKKPGDKPKTPLLKVKEEVQEDEAPVKDQAPAEDESLADVAATATFEEAETTMEEESASASASKEFAGTQPSSLASEINERKSAYNNENGSGRNAPAAGKMQLKLSKARGSVMEQKPSHEAPVKSKAPPLLSDRAKYSAWQRSPLGFRPPPARHNQQPQQQRSSYSLFAPAVWERAVDLRRGAVYYWDHISGTSSWNPPHPDVGWWERLWDEVENLEFFWNSATQETVWHLRVPTGTTLSLGPLPTGPVSSAAVLGTGTLPVPPPPAAIGIGAACPPRLMPALPSCSSVPRSEKVRAPSAAPSAAPMPSSTGPRPKPRPAVAPSSGRTQRVPAPPKMPPPPSCIGMRPVPTPPSMPPPAKWHDAADHSFAETSDWDLGIDDWEEESNEQNEEQPNNEDDWLDEQPNDEDLWQDDSGWEPEVKRRRADKPKKY